MPEGWTSTQQISYPSTVSKRIDTFVTAGLPMASDIAVVILGQATIELLQPIRPHCNRPQVHHQAHRLVVGPRIHKLLELPPHTTPDLLQDRLQSIAPFHASATGECAPRIRSNHRPDPTVEPYPLPAGPFKRGDRLLVQTPRGPPVTLEPAAGAPLGRRDALLLKAGLAGLDHHPDTILVSHENRGMKN